MADYGRVAFQQGDAVVTDGAEVGRVAFQQGDAVVTDGAEVGRVAFQQGDVVATSPLNEFRVANVFVEVFVELRQIKGTTDTFQGAGGIRRGLGQVSGLLKR